MLADLESLDPGVRWHGSARTVVYTLFAKSGFPAGLEAEAEYRDDVHLYAVEDVLDLF